MNIEALKEAHDLSLDGRDFAARQIILDVIANLEKEALAQTEQKYHRGDRLICLETEEYCVIHISGTDRQWVKFPDSHIGVYTNEQVAELFELLPKEPEQETVAWEQFYPDIGKPQIEVGCAECGVGNHHALYCVACAEKFVGEAATKLQQKQETIAGLNRDYDLLFAEHQLLLKKEWVGLTDEEIADIVIEMNGNEPTAPFWRDLAQAIEAAHGIKE